MKKKLAELINILFGFRKTLLVLILYIVGIIFRVKNLIDGAQFVDLAKGITISFMTANMGEHITSTIKEYVVAKAGGKPTVVDAEPEVAEDGPAGDPEAPTSSK